MSKQTVVKKSKVPHIHFWAYPHTIWEGQEGKNNVAVVRYCRCGKKQMAFSGRWGRIPKAYQIDWEGLMR